jgi:hypothetical protein
LEKNFSESVEPDQLKLEISWKLFREISFPIVRYREGGSGTGKDMDNQLLDNYVGQRIAPIHILSDTKVDTPHAADVSVNESLPISLTAGVVMRTYCNRETKDKFSLLSSDTAVFEQSFQHRCFINICHNSELPILHSPSIPNADMVVQFSDLTQLDWLLREMRAGGIYLLSSSPKLGVPVAPAIVAAPASPSATSSREIIIYDVVIASAVFYLLQEYLIDTSTTEDLKDNEIIVSTGVGANSIKVNELFDDVMEYSLIFTNFLYIYRIL